jgi:hypothetical protein
VSVADSDRTAGRVNALSAERRQLVERLRGGAADTNRIVARPAGQDTAPLSYAQEQMWMLDRIVGSSVLASAPLAIRLRGPLDASALRAAVATVVARHEVLRTTLDVAGAEGVQVVHPAGFADFAEQPAASLDDCLAAARAEIADGFDLRTGPLLRTRLYRLAADDHVLLFVRHHITFDARSDEVLVSELATAYVGAGPLPDLPVQYADVALWERRTLTGERLESLLAFWRDRLADAPPSPFRRTSRPGAAAGELTVPVPADVAARVLALAQAEQVTPYTLMLALLRVVLWRQTGQRDVVVGTPMSGRTRPETQRLIGFFLNMLLLRGDLGGDPAVRDLIARERDLVLSAYDHQELPFGRLARDLGRPDAGPLFALTFSHDTVPPAEALTGLLPGLRAEPVVVPGAATQHDLNVKVISQGPAMSVHVAYAEESFDEATIRGLAEQYVACLDEATTDPDRPISTLVPSAGTPLATPIPAAGATVLAWSTGLGDAGGEPANELESLVADMWTGLLDLPVPGVHANLFELGGHSLTVATLAYRIEESFGLPVTIADLMEHPTVAGQALLIEDQLTRRLAALTDEERERLFDSAAPETHP